MRSAVSVRTVSVLDRSLSRTCKTAAVSLVFAVAVIAAFTAPAGATVRVEAGSGGLAVTSPVVLSVQVRNRSVPYTGGVVHFTVKLRRANTCKLGVAGTPAVAIAFTKAWQHCSNGIFRHAVRLGRNSGQTARNAAFRVYLRRGTEIHWYPLGSVRVAGAPPAPTASLTISASTVTSAGASVTLTYSSTNVSTCSLSAIPTFWSGSNPMSVPCNGTTTLTVSSSTSARQWTFTFTATNSDGRSATATTSLNQSVLSFSQSPNWSGYVVQGASTLITDVSGQWTVPTLNCVDTPNAAESSWVGIGGWGTGTGDLLQTGIQDECVNGVQQEVGWWFEVSSAGQVIGDSTFTNFPVSPGNTIAAYVYQSAGQWVTRVDDLTTGLSGWMVTGESWGVGADSSGTFTPQGSTATLSYVGGYSGEWIVEDPGGTPPVAFANYGTVTFTNLGLAGLSPWYLTASEGEEMVQNGVVLSTPSAPGSDSFSVSYTGP